MQNSFRFEAFDVFFNQIKAFVYGAISPMKLNVKYFDNFSKFSIFPIFRPGQDTPAFAACQAAPISSPQRSGPKTASQSPQGSGYAFDA